MSIAGDVPALPKYNITKLNLREADHGQKGLGADASIVVANQFPVQVDLPPVAVDVLINGCAPSDKHLKVGTAETAVLKVRPDEDIKVNVTLPKPAPQLRIHIYARDKPRMAVRL